MMGYTIHRTTGEGERMGEEEGDGGEQVQDDDDGEAHDKEKVLTDHHERFMREALELAEEALEANEVPVGCVLVKDGEVIARGRNNTNATLNATRHAEFEAIDRILTPDLASRHASSSPLARQERQHPSIFREIDLYVTVEPCIMCASALRQVGIRSVYFGCANDKFGGVGSVLDIHSTTLLGPSLGYPYAGYGGIYREEAILLLRRFYVQENTKAPKPKQKSKRVLKMFGEDVGADFPSDDEDGER